MKLLPLPTSALSQHVVCLGKTGSGKSSKLRVLVEYQLEQDHPVTIIDPKGDWWGLKSSADGKKEGFPLVIFGGERADVPINEHSGAHVAELLATGNRSALVDLGGWMVGERTRFFIDFASTYFKLMRGVRTLVLPEVHNFAPQGKVLDPAAGKMLHWANRLASEGRGKGLTILADSQRPQKVHKDFLTSCETLIACRVIHKLDRDAIKDWIDGCADVAAGKQVLSELAQMQRADAWVWSPEIEFGPQRVTWPMFKTYDSFKAQSADTAKLKGWAEVDLDDVRSKLASVMQEAEANDPKRLKARIADLERELRKPKDMSITTEMMASEFERGLAQGIAHGYIAGLNAARAAFESIESSFTANYLSALNDSQQQQIDAVKITTNPHRVGADLSSIKPGSQFRTSDGATVKVKPAPVGSSEIDKPMPRAFLTALAQHADGLTKGQLLIHTGYRSSGPVSKTFAEILRAGWVSVGGGKLMITSAGLKALGPYEPLPVGAELRDFLLSGDKVSTMEKAMLRVLFDVYPNSITKGEILTRTGYKSSGPVSKCFARLVALGYARKAARGELSASEDLF